MHTFNPHNPFKKGNQLMSFHFKINQPANISYPTLVFLCVNFIFIF